ncbi:MAG: hypothetical protein MUC29_04030 [Pyrinomonadaceae bacterium]|jgi:hypothetical protein|nr:hypothetical protein [Pyrinomonadaceae bacterium]
MEQTVSLKMTKKQAKNLEDIIDKTLNALLRLENESPIREASIAKSQAETNKIKKDIQKELAVLKSRNLV